MEAAPANERRLFNDDHDDDYEHDDAVLLGNLDHAFALFTGNKIDQPRGNLLLKVWKLMFFQLLHRLYHVVFRSLRTEWFIGVA